MDIDQVIKQLEWMDEERRRDKAALSTLQDRVNAYAENLEGANQRLKAMDEEAKRISVLVGRLNQFDGVMVQQRVEIRRMMDESEKRMARGREESDKALRTQIKALETQIADINHKYNLVQEMRKDLQAEIGERIKLERSIDNAELKMEDFAHTIEDFTRTYRQFEETRRQETKQMDALSAEVITLRKRMDERRAEIEGLGVNMNRLDNKLTEMMALDNTRQADQQAFIESQNALQVEREHTLKEWLQRLETFERQGNEAQAQLNNLDATHRIVKRSQEAVDMLSDRLERRLNEITELNRLSEERFRQEWTTFRSDDQKRWADYTLSQDERNNEFLRQYDKLLAKLDQLEDYLHISRELMTRLNSYTEKGLQTFLNVAHDWLETYQKMRDMEIH